MSAEPETCANCDAPLHGRYCSACGQDGSVRRLTLSALAGPALDALFSVESRLFRTLAGLTRDPGGLASRYVEGRRARYVHPFRYYVVVLAAYALAVVGLGGDALSTGAFRVTSEGGDQAEVTRIVAEWMGTILLLALPLLAWSLRLLFPRSGRNSTESYVLALYTVAHAHALAIPVLLLGLLAPELGDAVRRLLPVAWVAWGAVVFFRAPVVTGVLRVLLALLVYFVACAGLAVAVLAAVLRLGG